MAEKLPYLVVTHVNQDGPGQFLNRYLVTHSILHSYIEHPFLHSQTRQSSNYVTHGANASTQEQSGWRWPKSALFYFPRDFFGTMWFGLRHRAEIGIGFDNLNTLSLILLRFLGRIERVVYVTVDYTPKRFANSLLNRIYHSIDRLCCRYADMLWDSAEAMTEARRLAGVDVARIRNRLVVDDGNDFEADKIPTPETIRRHQFVYMGSIRQYQGIGLAIDVTEALQRRNANVSLTILGGGPLLEQYRTDVLRRGLDSFITFTGFIEDHKDVQAQIRGAYLAFALYEDDPASYSKYSAVGKPKVYLGCGVPVVITDVPEIARKIASAGAGLLVPSIKEEIVDQIASLMSDETRYMEMREAAIAFAAANTWEATFKTALRETNARLGYPTLVYA